MPTDQTEPGLRDVVTSPERRTHFVAAGLWTEETLVSRVAHWAAVAPERPAVLDGVDAAARSYARLWRDAQGIAARLSSLGVGPRSVVSVQMPNWYETVVVDLGVWMLGAVLNPLLPIYRVRELANAIEAAGTRVFVTPSVYRRVDYVDLVRQARAGRHDVQHLVVDRGQLSDVIREGEPPEAPLDAADVSELIFSSGTEAAPKAIMHTEQTTNCGVRIAADAIGLTASDSVWMPSPIGHSTGLNYGVRMALYHGLPLVLQDIWDAHEAVKLIERARPTYTVAATTFLSDLIDAAEHQGADISSLRLFNCGGAPVPAVLVERAARDHGVTVLRLYGSTEALIGSWNRVDSPLEKRLSTEGLPFPDVELEVRDDVGTSVRGEVGELFVRSPTTSVGFFADAERTAATFLPGGWLRTGDLGVLDADGYFTMIGRKKEILIRGGLNVAPREIEDLMIAMPGVLEVAVVPVPHARLGEIGCACVVTEPGVTLTLDDVVDFLRDQGLAPYKLPERLVLFDNLPKTPTGKIQKFELISTAIERRSDDQETTR